MTQDELKAAIRKGTLDMKIVPISAEAPIRTRAFSRCSTRFIDYLPSPLDKGAVPGIQPGH